MKIPRSKAYLALKCIVYPDDYVIGDDSVIIKKNSMFPWRRRVVFLPKREIDMHTSYQTFMGYIFNYGHIIVISDGVEYSIKGISKFSQLRWKIDKLLGKSL